MKYVIIASVLLLSGCSIENWEIEKAQRECSPGTIDHINTFISSSVVCSDGKLVSLQRPN